LGVDTGGKKISAAESIRKTVEAVWADFDADGNGVLDHDEARQFFNTILTTMEGKTKFGPNDFDSWIITLDKDGSGTIDQKEFIEFLTKTLAFEMGQSSGPTTVKNAPGIRVFGVSST